MSGVRNIVSGSCGVLVPNTEAKIVHLVPILSIPDEKFSWNFFNNPRNLDEIVVKTKDKNLFGKYGQN
jgi:hypothetical protein